MAEDTEAKRPAAPYIAFSTLKTFIAPLKQHIVPTRIERSLLSNISGTVQGQLMTALRFLRLIDAEDRPTDSLKALVADFGKDAEWKDSLKIVLENAYPELFRLPLENIPPQEFNDAFKAAYPCEGGTLRKSVTFFINAAREAGVGISPFLTKGAKPRTGPVRRKANGAASAKKTTSAAAAADPAANAGNDRNPPPNKSVEEQLLAKFPNFDPNWPDELKAKWFEGYTKLLNMRAA